MYIRAYVRIHRNMYRFMHVYIIIYAYIRYLYTNLSQRIEWLSIQMKARRGYKRKRKRKRKRRRKKRNVLLKKKKIQFGEVNDVD
jgi:hypothetical protein